MIELNINDYECVVSNKPLNVYKKKGDESIYSVKHLVCESNMKADNHPIFNNTKKLIQSGSKIVPKVFGYTFTKREGYNELLIFLEHFEGTLVDYIESSTLNKEDIKKFFSFIDEFIEMDKTTYMTPAYLTGYNFLINHDSSGKIVFKVFGYTEHDDSVYPLPLEDYRWISPELFEKKYLKRTHIIIDAEKSLLYSFAVILIYSLTRREFISEGREGVKTEQFNKLNSQREDQEIRRCMHMIKSNYNDPNLEVSLGKLLTYNPQERPNFRIWQASGKGMKSGPNTVASNQYKSKGHKKVPSGTIEIENDPELQTNKKTGKSACCSIF